MKINHFGVRIDDLRPIELEGLIQESLLNKSRILIEGINVAKLITCKNDNYLRHCLNTAAVCHLDGKGISLAFKLFYKKEISNYPGIDLMDFILEQLNSISGKVYLLGATEDIVRGAQENIVLKFPKLEVCGYRNGYFKDDEIGAILDEINEKMPDVLLIGISSPKKERFLNDNWNKLSSVVIGMGVGGSFDVLANKVTRAPEWMQKSGLEWVTRLLQEPRRLFWRYLHSNTVYLWMLIIDKLTGKNNGKQN
jgi:N-acetylglucosaminyldiphosphoundecaprenol N-acetyl-beta-D-mannosaminyltransferase